MAKPDDDAYEGKNNDQPADPASPKPTNTATKKTAAKKTAKKAAAKKDDDRVPKRVRMARQYGFVQAFFDTDPELKRLFNQAVKNTWSPERFIAELRDTKWFRTNSVSVRNAIMQKTADPETYRERVKRLAATIRDTWGATFGNTQGMLEDGEIRRWAETAYMMDWSEAQVMDQIAKSVNFHKLIKSKNLGGTAAELKTSIEALGRAYGLNVGDRFIANQVEKIVSGRDTKEGTALRLREWAKREYAAFAAELDGGATIEDIAEPYIGRMAELLELNPESIHAREGMIQKALKARGQDGKPAALSLADFEDMVRRDRRWQYTNNAREQGMAIVHGLLRDFGLVSN